MKKHVLALALLLLTESPAGAVGIADTPLPELVPGETTYHVYSVPGTIASQGLETFFSCTSLEPTATIQVGVQMFLSGGVDSNDPIGTSLSLSPGMTRVFATGPALGISVDSVVGGGGSRGSARILATSKKLACNAFVADATGIPPTSMTYLTIIAKIKQKAAN